jgi:hypothetical protein
MMPSLSVVVVLRKDNLVFGNHYLQINETAMGTKMAPSYANIFMGDQKNDFSSRFAKRNNIHGNKRGIF